jgi:hypothetical protein
MQHPDEPLAPLEDSGCEQIFVLLQRCCELQTPEEQAIGLFGCCITGDIGKGP